MTAYSNTFASALPHNALGRADLIVETVFLTIAFLCTSVRLWSRRLNKTQLQANDYLVLTALVIATARYALMVVLVVKCGLGLHINEVDSIGGPDTIVIFHKLIYATDLMWITLVVLIKVSILHFYSVTFPVEWFRYLVYGVMAFAIAFWVAAFFSQVFFCIPPQKLWLPNIPGHCSNMVTNKTAVASIDLGIDIVVIALPMPLLWRLNLATAKKISLTFIFGLGFIIIIFTSVRLHFISELDSPDITYEFLEIGITTSLVPLLGVLTANLPISYPVFKRVFLIPSPQSSRAADPDNFHRLREEEYRLTNIES
ncbi:hypothetical protein F5B22DRAFT_636972 [Xylaria bambusicola]|uniref:uncharacterized protein n=1 Tax=Xylaria bambusicola TaxID=326684 RepID=UPI0020081A75|nr:uncharacterized protein F5B22DRAFT_636972 [Xylaria bambusicola]KAI0514648.1 hypothetical protein F5B22DRAFT_636972 [Xylaria bambusicola]